MTMAISFLDCSNSTLRFSCHKCKWNGSNLIGFFKQNKFQSTVRGGRALEKIRPFLNFTLLTYTQ